MASTARRHVITAVTLVVLLVVLLTMAAVGVKKALQPFPEGKKAAADSGCADKQKQVQQVLTRKDVQVSVFNAGSRSGLASSTLDKVEAAGFVAGNAGNAPGTANVRRAVVWTTKDDDYSAKLVALAFGPRTQIEVTKTDLGPGVDVLVGNGFKGLSKRAPKQLELPKPVETCIEGG